MGANAAYNDFDGYFGAHTVSSIVVIDAGGIMVKDRQAALGRTSYRQGGREGESMIKIEVTSALKDALEHAVASGTPQVALYKDKPVVILSYDEYERLNDEDEDQRS
jgi:hypothetical protein